MEIKNTTTAPVRVPLPAGKRLFLSPGGKAKIANKATEHPPVKALIEAGTLELLDGGKSKKGASAKGRVGPSQDHSGGGVRHTGDR